MSIIYSNKDFVFNRGKLIRDLNLKQIWKQMRPLYYISYKHQKTGEFFSKQFQFYKTKISKKIIFSEFNNYQLD